MAPTITEKSQKCAQSGSPETPKMTLKPEQQENGKRGLRRQQWRRTRDNVECTKPQESQHSNTLYYTVLCVYHRQRIVFCWKSLYFSGTWLVCDSYIICTTQELQTVAPHTVAFCVAPQLYKLIHVNTMQTLNGFVATMHQNKHSQAERKTILI